METKPIVVNKSRQHSKSAIVGRLFFFPRIWQYIVTTSNPMVHLLLFWHLKIKLWGRPRKSSKWTERTCENAWSCVGASSRIGTLDFRGQCRCESIR
eukprot:2762444-Amphidinium_carterae.1